MEDKKIKLPMALGLEVSKILSSLGIKSKTNRKGMITLEFEIEDLDKIETITLTNPSRNILSGIENLRNLKKLSIKTFMDTQYRQNKNIASISSKDMKLIENIKTLTKLEIINQNGIHNIDLSKLTNLEELKIIENENLDNLKSLDILTNLKVLELYENKNLFEVNGLNNTINKNKLNKLVLSLLYFGEAINYDKETVNIDIECLEKMHKLGSECFFVEVSNDLNMIKISADDALKFHQKCLTLIDNKFAKNTDTLGYIIGIEDYLTRNITYDYDAMNHNFTHRDETTPIGPLYGANSSYNAIMYKTCTCEGYTRAMIYLLKLVGINSHLVSCNKSDHEDYIQDRLPDDGFHSVISINDYYNLYCDPAWDSFKYNNGDSYNYLPFTLLSKEEISKTHSLMYDEKSTGNEKLVIPRKMIEAYLKSNIEEVQKVI